MEDKESTESGSLGGDSEFDSPPTENGGAHGGAGSGGMAPAAVSMGASIRNAALASSPAVAVPGGVLAAAAGDVLMGGGVVGSGGGVLGGGGGASSEVVMGKKKRGRPRKYDADGNIRPGYVRSPPGATAKTPSQPGFTLSTTPSCEFKTGTKRGRGKSSGSGNWNALASLGGLFANTAGGDFTPHVVTVHTGEDIAGKILTFAQKGSRGVCVLSANGSVSNVTIRQPGSAGGLLTYEGRFEILTLTGSYTVSENNGIRSRNGGLSVSLASSDGRIIGGGVAGMLMAASPIQIVVGSFEANGSKTQKRKQKSEPRVTSFQFAPATVTAAIPISQAAPANNSYPISMSQVQSRGEADQSLSNKDRPNSTSTDTPANNSYPISMSQVQSRGEADQSLSNKDHPNSTSTDTSDWNDSGPSSDHRPSPDINISIPVGEQKS